MRAFEIIIEKSLRKCPLILYLPNEDEDSHIILHKIVNAKVIDDDE